jgi:hypothetical protein
MVCFGFSVGVLSEKPPRWFLTFMLKYLLIMLNICIRQKI